MCRGGWTSVRRPSVSRAFRKIEIAAAVAADCEAFDRNYEKMLLKFEIFVAPFETAVRQFQVVAGDVVRAPRKVAWDP